MNKFYDFHRKAIPILGFSVLILSFNMAAQDYEWPHYANGQGSSKYADLDQINRETVSDLQVAWVWGSVDNAQIAQRPQFVPAGFKSTPIQIDGTLYISTSLGNIAALDAVTGEQKWAFDTGTWEHGRPANMGFNHRGVGYWEEGSKKRIIMGTNNAFLWSIDAETGLPDRSFGREGKVRHMFLIIFGTIALKPVFVSPGVYRKTSRAFKSRKQTSNSTRHSIVRFRKP